MRDALPLASILFSFFTHAAELPETYNLTELHDHEIAGGARIKIKKVIPDHMFLGCVPKESIPFPKGDWPSSYKEKIFARDALGDLMKCSSKSCAFNFLPTELSVLEKISDPAARQNQYMQFFRDRVEGRTGLDPSRIPEFFRSKDNAFEGCNAKPWNDLLDLRPSVKAPFRLSHVRYSARMRPTTRLVQSASFPLNADQGSGVCYGEAMIFSDHYDEDRIEMWKLQRLSDGNSIISHEVRNRIDLLNSWFRRLNKKNMRDEMKVVISDYVKDVVQCLQ